MKFLILLLERRLCGKLRESDVKILLIPPHYLQNVTPLNDVSKQTKRGGPKTSPHQHEGFITPGSTPEVLLINDHNE